MKNEKPGFYASIYGILKEIADEYGYALAIHGSLVRDLDLVAIPWKDEVKDYRDMISHMRESIGMHHPQNVIGETKKPHGRLSFIILTGAGSYVDLAVFPPKERE